MTNEEILETAAKNAAYIVELETELERSRAARAGLEHAGQEQARRADENQRVIQQLRAACKRAAELYDHLALSPLEAAAKYGPDYKPPTDEEWLEMRGMLNEALVAHKA